MSVKNKKKIITFLPSDSVLSALNLKLGKNPRWGMTTRLINAALGKGLPRVDAAKLV